jgi:ABC-type transporter Mla subunit MlaD
VKLPTVSDVIHFGSEQVEALATLPDTIVQLNRTLTSFAQTVARLDTLVRRIDRLTEPLEAPMAALTPRIEALVPLLDQDLIGSLPALIDAVQRNAIPALEVMGQTQAQVASIAASVDRLMHVMDDGFARLQDLPGAALVSRLRGSGSGAKGAGPAGGSAGAGGAGAASGATGAR